ncbi:nitroreductase family protein [Pseudooceanicola marinus]|uniref:nitroreductase family protein n=1 Tax=Pseudooceanicola marinus TaxID=396013 RepID=UPI001CD80283|nr:nitroreductase family protein [Pseudooceanicola marinus]MCA1338155.1 nitroreductase family protein [Pseudooceanicola marinus]
MRKVLKKIVFSIPGGPEALAATRARKRRRKVNALRRRCYAADVANDIRYLNWHREGADYWKLSSELIFQHHKLEKGLCLPPEARAWFGRTAALETFRLMEEWKTHGFDRSAPVYQSALGILAAYRARLEGIADDNPERLELIARITAYLEDTAPEPAYATPLPARPAPEGVLPMLQELALARRSTRNFTDRKVDPAMVAEAARIGALAPSACNRQPWKVHLYDDPARIRAMLELQNGNSGFGHTVPLLAVICADQGSFFDSSERFEPVLDGGLFLMSFLYGLQAQGLASCCLNWAVPPERDAEGHARGDIPPEHKILTFLAVGHPAPGAVVPLSGRRPLEDTLHWHSETASVTSPAAAAAQ